MKRSEVSLELTAKHGLFPPSPTSDDQRISLPLDWPRNPFSGASGEDGKVDNDEESLEDYLTYCCASSNKDDGDKDGKGGNSVDRNEDKPNSDDSEEILFQEDAAFRTKHGLCLSSLQMISFFLQFRLGCDLRLPKRSSRPGAGRSRPWRGPRTCRTGCPRRT